MIAKPLLLLFRSSKKRKHTKHQFLSLIGNYHSHTTGHIFLCHLIDLSMTVQHPHHRLPITLEIKWDLARWQDFLSSLSGTSFILDTYWTSSSDIQLFTDASGSKGCGAFWNSRWLQYKYTSAQSAMSGKSSLPLSVLFTHRDIFGQYMWLHIGGWHLVKGLYMWQVIGILSYSCQFCNH